MLNIPETELEWSYVRSSGPGGQNVNKVNSKVVLRWNVATTPSLPPEVRARFLEQFANRINLAGELLLSSDRFRDQPRNREECLQKLKDMIAQVRYPPKKRKKSRPTRSSQLRRQEGKKRQSDKKSSRRKFVG